MNIEAKVTLPVASPYFLPPPDFCGIGPSWGIQRKLPGRSRHCLPNGPLQLGGNINAAGVGAVVRHYVIMCAAV